MEARKQFSLRHLLIEVALIGVTLGAARVALAIFDRSPDSPVLVPLVAITILPGLCGAIVGGLVGQFWKGAFWGTITVGGFWVIAALLT